MGQTIDLSSRLVGAGGSIATPRAPMEGGSSTTAHHKMIGADESATALEEPEEGSGSAAVPPDMREVRPLVQEQGAGSKWSCPSEVE